MDDLYYFHFEEGTVFRVKTNADIQFKCCWNLFCWLDFSKSNNITVICYYGIADHGKGLVDTEYVRCKKSFDTTSHKGRRLMVFKCFRTGRFP